MIVLAFLLIGALGLLVAWMGHEYEKLKARLDLLEEDLVWARPSEADRAYADTADAAQERDSRRKGYYE